MESKQFTYILAARAVSIAICKQLFIIQCQTYKLYSHLQLDRQQMNFTTENCEWISPYQESCEWFALRWSIEKKIQILFLSFSFGESKSENYIQALAMKDIVYFPLNHEEQTIHIYFDDERCIHSSLCIHLFENDSSKCNVSQITCIPISNLIHKRQILLQKTVN